MNIFFVDKEPYTAARQLVDKHVVKMIVETAQLLSTAHRILDGTEYIDDSSGRKIKRWRHPIALMDEKLYKATHANHPSCVWLRKSKYNYEWLYHHFLGLLEEYKFRYDKEHKTGEIKFLLSFIPKAISDTGFTYPPLCMPDEYKISDDPTVCYQHYILRGKPNLLSWKKREVPHWAKDQQYVRQDKTSIDIK